jgi:glucose/arabinose dehydrogenase
MVRKVGSRPYAAGRIPFVSAFVPSCLGGYRAALLLLTVSLASSFSQAQPKRTTPEDDYYKIIQIPIPEHIALECGGMEVLPNNKLAVSTRRGDIYIIEGAYSDPPNVKYTLFATGLHECMGIAYNAKDGFLYAVQRPEVTRLKDTDGDGKADVYETFCDGWGISGDYHEYPFMSKFDKDGNLYVVLCLTGSFTSDAPFRGWCVKITPQGKMIPYASGIRSPAGLAFNDKGELFYTDNQGPWNGTSSLKQLLPGAFEGHPIGNKWYKLAPNMGPQPPDPKDKSRIYIEAARIKEFIPPVSLLPHVMIGQSSSGIICDMSNGKFGPYKDQMFVADQHHANIARIVLQKVNGRYQSVCFPFRYGFSSGIVPMIQGTDGSFFVGGTNRGWGSVGHKEFSLERLVWTGKTAFEMFDMKVTPDGFDVTFTEPLDTELASDVKNYDLSTFTYIYRAEYGSPEVDQTKPTVRSVTVAPDGKKVHLVVDGLKIGSIHQLKVDNLKSVEGKKVLHPIAWYTLWNIPEK